MWEDERLYTWWSGICISVFCLHFSSPFFCGPSAFCCFIFWKLLVDLGCVEGPAGHPQGHRFAGNNPRMAVKRWKQPRGKVRGVESGGVSRGHPESFLSGVTDIQCDRHVRPCSLGKLHRQSVPRVSLGLVMAPSAWHKPEFQPQKESRCSAYTVFGAWWEPSWNLKFPDASQRPNLQANLHLYLGRESNPRPLSCTWRHQPFVIQAANTFSLSMYHLSFAMQRLFF